MGTVYVNFISIRLKKKKKRSWAGFSPGLWSANPSSVKQSPCTLPCRSNFLNFPYTANGKLPCPMRKKTHPATLSFFHPFLSIAKILLSTWLTYPQASSFPEGRKPLLIWTQCEFLNNQIFRMQRKEESTAVFQHKPYLVKRERAAMEGHKAT